MYDQSSVCSKMRIGKHCTMCSLDQRGVLLLQYIHRLNTLRKYHNQPSNQPSRIQKMIPKIISSEERKKKVWSLVTACLLVTLISVGVGIYLVKEKRSESFLSRGNFWRPSTGTPWQIVLNGALEDQSNDAPIYDVDLFLNGAEVVRNLHASGKKVICYFSAGSFEPYRPDTNQFHASDLGRQLVGWPDEYWLDTNSHNIRNIMRSRLKYAARIGCDGVDPDNIDAYDNANGLGLTATDAISFLKFLATEAHGLNLSIGLKNAGYLVPFVLDFMEWEVNEQCLQFRECGKFQPFIETGKPVFHIEYADVVPGVSSTLNSLCGEEEARGFSTVLKHSQLDNWALNC